MVDRPHFGIELSDRQLRRWGRRVFDTFLSSGDSAVVPFGKACVWHVHTRAMPASGFIVSAGVGNDISFEKELVASYRCRVLLLDPSPTGIATMARPENQVPGIEFLDVGLAGTDGDIPFSRPKDESEGSFRLGQSGTARVNLPCRSLSSLMHERGRSVIDLLKLDIEGFEYDVLKDVLRSDVQVRQLCIEFHHFVDGIPLSRTLSALAALYRAGFRLTHKQGSDYTLVNVRSVASM